MYRVAASAGDGSHVSMRLIGRCTAARRLVRARFDTKSKLTLHTYWGGTVHQQHAFNVRICTYIHDDAGAFDGKYLLFVQARPMHR